MWYTTHIWTIVRDILVESGRDICYLTFSNKIMKFLKVRTRVLLQQSVNLILLQ